MESQNELLKKVNLCMSRNIPKLAVAMLVMGIITTSVTNLIAILLANLIEKISMLPVAESIMVGSLNYSVLVATLVVILLSFIMAGLIWSVFDYGFFVFIILLYRGQPTVFLHLFAGFHDFKRIFFTSFFLAFRIFAVMLLFAVVTNLAMALTLSLSEEVKDYLNTAVSILFILVGYIVLCSRYGFVCFLLYEQPDLKVRDALKLSTTLIMGNRLKFALFCIKTSGGYLLVYVVLLSVAVLLPQSIFVNLAFLLYSFVSFTRMSIVFVAWYTSCNDSKLSIDNTSDTVIELAGSCTDDSSKNTGD